MVAVIVAILILIVILFVLFKVRKMPLDSLVMINGSVGAGKTSTAVNLAIKSHKKNLRKYYIKKWLSFGRKVESEKPCLYSNIPLFGVEYCPLTNDLILRKKRFAYKSIVLISESSLIANSMSFKDKKVNDRLTMFIKLIRHELHGTYARVPNMIVETQSINDNHFAFDRCIVQSLFIVKSIRFLPFVRLVKAREILNVQNVQNVVSNSVKDDSSFKWYIVPKKVFKMYDSFAYSMLTDNLSVDCDLTKYNKKVKTLFEIATFLDNEELRENNEKFLEVLDSE